MKLKSKSHKLNKKSKNNKLLIKIKNSQMKRNWIKNNKRMNIKK